MVSNCGDIRTLHKEHGGKKWWKANKQIELLKSTFSLNLYCTRRGVYSKWFVWARALTATLPVYELWAEDEG